VSISAAERAVLLETADIHLQILRITASRPGRRIRQEELRGIFPELSSGRFLSALFSLTGKGSVKMEDGWIRCIAPLPSRGSIADKVWKAIILHDKEFTNNDIKDLLPDVPIQTIRSLTSIWIQNGFIRIKEPRDNIKKPNILAIISKNEGIRPAVSRSRHPRDSSNDSKADQIWQRLSEMGETTSRELSETFPSASHDYIKTMLSQWVKVGVVEYRQLDGKTRVYSIRPGTARPPVFRAGEKRR